MEFNKMREKLVLPPRVTAAQRRGLPPFLVGSSSSSRHLLLCLIITGTSSCGSPRLPSPLFSLSQIHRSGQAHLAMADEKLAKLKEAVAGLAQIR